MRGLTEFPSKETAIVGDLADDARHRRSLPGAWWLLRVFLGGCTALPIVPSTSPPDDAQPDPTRRSDGAPLSTHQKLPIAVRAINRVRQAVQRPRMQEFLIFPAIVAAFTVFLNSQFNSNVDIKSWPSFFQGHDDQQPQPDQPSPANLEIDAEPTTAATTTSEPASPTSSNTNPALSVQYPTFFTLAWMGGSGFYSLPETDKLPPLDVELGDAEALSESELATNPRIVAGEKRDVTLLWSDGSVEPEKYVYQDVVFPTTWRFDESDSTAFSGIPVEDIVQYTEPTTFVPVGANTDYGFDSNHNTVVSHQVAGPGRLHLAISMSRHIDKAVPSIVLTWDGPTKCIAPANVTSPCADKKDSLEWHWSG